MSPEASCNPLEGHAASLLWRAFFFNTHMLYMRYTCFYEVHLYSWSRWNVWWFNTDTAAKAADGLRPDIYMRFLEFLHFSTSIRASACANGYLISHRIFHFSSRTQQWRQKKLVRLCWAPRSAEKSTGILSPCKTGVAPWLPVELLINTRMSALTDF